MSHGALTGASHMTIAAAVNELDTLSNSGEGGEARWRNDIPERAWGPFWEKVRQQRRGASGGLLARRQDREEPLPQPDSPGRERTVRRRCRVPRQRR